MRGAAREGDLADAQGSGLVLVELERGDELPRERLQLPPSGLARGRELVLGEALRHLLRACERERPLDRLDLARGHVERAGDGDVERPAAPLEHAGELADAAVGDGEGGAVVADRDGDEGAALRGRARGMGRCDRAQQRERLEVDPDDLQAGLAAGEDVAVDELAVGDDEEHAPERLAVLGHALGEHLVVEHRLLERDRQHLLGAEADRVRELLRVVDAGDLEGADADPVVRDPEPDAALRQLVLGEERLEGERERLGVAELAVDDDAVVEPDTRGLHELGRLAVADARGRDLRAADLEADELLATAAAAREGRQRRQLQRGACPLRLRRRLVDEPLAGVPLLRAALEREVALVERHPAARRLLLLLLLRALGLRLLRLLRLLRRLVGLGRALERELLLVEGHLRRVLLAPARVQPRARVRARARPARRARREARAGRRSAGRGRAPARAPGPGSAPARAGVGIGAIGIDRRGRRLDGHGLDGDRLDATAHGHELGRRIGDLLERLRQPVVLDRRSDGLCRGSLGLRRQRLGGQRRRSRRRRRCRRPGPRGRRPRAPARADAPRPACGARSPSSRSSSRRTPRERRRHSRPACAGTRSPSSRSRWASRRRPSSASGEPQVRVQRRLFGSLVLEAGALEQPVELLGAARAPRARPRA